MALERPCCAERNVCKSVLGSGIVNCPFTLNWGIKRISPSGLHNNSACADNAAALERDEADTATARTTALIEKMNIAETPRMNFEPARSFAFLRRLADRARKLSRPLRDGSVGWS